MYPFVAEKLFKLLKFICANGKDASYEEEDVSTVYDDPQLVVASSTLSSPEGNSETLRALIPAPSIPWELDPIIEAFWARQHIMCDVCGGHGHHMDKCMKREINFSPQVLG